MVGRIIQNRTFIAAIAPVDSIHTHTHTVSFLPETAALFGMMALSCLEANQRIVAVFRALG